MYAATISDEDAEKLAPAIIKAMKTAGYKVEMDKNRAIDRLSYSDEAFGNEILDELHFVAQQSRKMQGGVIHPFLNILVSSCFAMLDRSIILNRPFFSLDAVGPVWAVKLSEKPLIDFNYIIIKIVVDEVGWFPKPNSLIEAKRMADDDMIHGLRKDIDLWSQKIAVGDISYERELRAIIKDKMAWFKNKSFASKVSRLVSYLAVPIAVGEILLKRNGLIGLSLASVGVAAQLIEDKIQTNKRKHWLSLGSDYISR